LKRLEQAVGHGRPRPLLLDDAAGAAPELLALRFGSPEERFELVDQVVDVARLERRRDALLLECIRDLRQAGVPGDERQRTAGGGFGGDHPEGFREDRRDDRHVGERDQVDEVPVLERPREEHVSSGHCLKFAAIVAETDDHGPGVDALERLEQQVDALVPDQLAEVEERWILLGEELGEVLGVPLVGQALVGASRVRGVAPRLLDQIGESVFATLGVELADIDAGRNLVDPVDVAHDVLEHLTDVGRADEDGAGVGERLASPAGKLLVAAHRVLELGAVGLDGER
jgi:hypothetical protein